MKLKHQNEDLRKEVENLKGDIEYLNQTNNNLSSGKGDIETRFEELRRRHHSEKT